MMDQSGLQPERIDARVFAQSVRALLAENPARYRMFGEYWFFVKALLKRFYDRHEMPMLGDYSDPSVNERIPAAARASGDAMLHAATDEYIQNASFNLGSSEVTDSDGEFFTLVDPDMAG